MRFVSLATQPWPVSGNLPGGKSGCFVVFNPAAHAMLRLYSGSRSFQPDFPPYTPIAPPEVIAPTQTAHAHELWGSLFLSHYLGSTTITDPYATSISETGGSSCP